MYGNELEIVITAKDAAGGAFKKTQGYVQNLTKDLFSLRSILTGTAGGLAGNMIGKDFMQTASAFERMEIQLDKITKGHGTAVLDELNQWALDMPVNTQKAVDSFRLLMAMGLNPTIETLETLTDVSAIFGEQTLSRLSLQLGQMSAKGKVMSQDLNIMAEAGINARKYLQDAFGMTVEELQGSGIEISKIVSVIFDGMRKDFGGSAKDMMKSWSGLKTVTRSYFVELERRVMDAGVFDAVKDSLSEFNDELKAWVDNNEDLIRQNVPIYIDNIKGSVDGLVTIYNSLPSEITGAAGYGLVGKMLWGGNAGKIIFVSSVINDGLKQMNMNIGSMSTKWQEYMAAWDNISAVATGLRDWNTGELIATPQRSVGKVTGWPKTDKAPKNASSTVDDIAAGATLTAAEKVALKERNNLQAEFQKEQTKLLKKNVDWQIQEIERRAEAYRQAGADSVAVTQWSEETIGAIIAKHNAEKTKSYQAAFDDYMALVFAESEAVKEAAEEEKKAAEERLRNSRHWRDGATRSLNDYAEASTDAATHMENAFVSGFNNMEDALVKMASTGKLEFSSLANSIVADLARITIRQSITGPLAMAMGQWMGSVAMGSSSANVSAGGMSSFAGAPMTMAGVNHLGGVVGYTANPTRSVPSSMFSGAPRFHDGLMPDEFPAILQRGEAVIPKNQVGKSGRPVTVNVNVKNSPYTPQVSAPRENADGSIDIDMIFEEMEGRMAANVAEGRGPLASTFESTYGADRSYGAVR